MVDRAGRDKTTVLGQDQHRALLCVQRELAGKPGQRLADHDDIQRHALSDGLLWVHRQPPDERQCPCGHNHVFARQDVILGVAGPVDEVALPLPVPGESSDECLGRLLRQGPIRRLYQRGRAVADLFPRRGAVNHRARDYIRPGMPLVTNPADWKQDPHRTLVSLTHQVTYPNYRISRHTVHTLRLIHRYPQLWFG